MTPRLSVIIAMHNGAPTITQAIGSLRGQAFESWEVVVIDDGSTDDGSAVVESIARADRRVRLICRPRGGPAAARNTGIDAARGEFLLFLDADDWMMPGGVAALMRAAERSSDGAAFGAAAWFDAGGAPLGFTSEPTCRCAGLDELLDHNRFMIHAAVISREALGGERFDPSLPASEDWDLWLRLAARGVRWDAVWDEVSAYRCVAGSRSRNWRAVADSSSAILRRAFDAARRTGAAADLSMERERRCLLRHALDAATASAAHDAAGWCGASAEILAPFASSGCIEAALAASAALWGLPMALATAPNEWLRQPRRFVPALARWWGRCVREGWMEESRIDAARGALARSAANAGAVASRIADALDPARPVALLGFGANGRRLARELITRGFAVAARDGHADAAGEETVIAGRTIRILPGCAAERGEAQCVVTPTDDRGLIESLPAGLSFIRWSDAAREEEERMLSVLRAAWPAEPAVRGIAA